MALKEGTKAPSFTLTDQEGVSHSLSDYEWKKVVLYFYPKDDTPGCTKEACSFRDNYTTFKKNDVIVLGVSPDSEKSHTKFSEKHALPFTLLSDVDHSVCELYDVWGLKKYMGREYFGVYRTTYVIDAQGTIIKTYENVKPDNHAGEIVDLLALT